METDGHRAHLTVGITPVLAEMLTAPRFRQGFEAYLDSRQVLAEQDAERLRTRGGDDGASLAAMWSDFYGTAKRDFNAAFSGDLIAAFRIFVRCCRISLPSCRAASMMRFNPASWPSAGQPMMQRDIPPDWVEQRRAFGFL